MAACRPSLEGALTAVGGEELPERTVEIHGIGSEGAGVGHLPDGRVVFVHRTAPGDRARIRVTEERKRWARGELIELLDASPGRRPAPCPHYARCGGCTLEHLEYTTQLRAKGRMIGDALERIGGFPERTPEVHPSPDEFRYRSRVTLTLVRAGGGRVVAGFHELGRPGRIVDLGGECLLPVEEVARAWDGLRESWGPEAVRLPRGRRIRLTLRAVDGGVILVLHDGDGNGDPVALLEAVPSLLAVWREGQGGRPRLLAGREDVTVTWLGDRVPVEGSAFLQVNRPAAARLHQAVLEATGEVEGKSVVDGYAGAGAYGRALARRGARVSAVELDPVAVRAARSEAHPGLDVLEGRVEDLLPGLLPAEMVLLNPPRTGLHRDVPRALLTEPPPLIVYVSCDQATLARDAARLRDGFELTGLQAFDLFPQTAHVEVLAVFSRS